MNKRTKHALKLRQKGLSFNQIGQDMGIGYERARQIVRKYEGQLKSLEDPFALKIKELGCLGDATRILNALKGNDYYDDGPKKLAKCNPEDILKINGIGMKRIILIAKALCYVSV